MCHAVTKCILISSANDPARAARKRLAMAVLAATLLLPHGARSAERTCREDIHVVDRCFEVRGRLRIEANARITLWPVGTERLLGVQYPGDLAEVGGSLAPLPPDLDELLGQNAAVFGDYVACPYTRSEPGKKQYICIEAARNLRPVR